MPTGEIVSGSVDSTAVSMERYDGGSDTADASVGAVFRSAHFEQEPAEGGNQQ